MNFASLQPRMAVVLDRAYFVFASVLIYLGHDVILSTVPNHNHFYYSTLHFSGGFYFEAITKTWFLYCTQESNLSVVHIIISPPTVIDADARNVYKTNRSSFTYFLIHFACFLVIHLPDILGFFS